MREALKVGDRATMQGMRRSHIIRSVDGQLAYTKCSEIIFWSRIGRDGCRLTTAVPLCKTCEKRQTAGTGATP